MNEINTLGRVTSMTTSSALEPGISTATARDSVSVDIKLNNDEIDQNENLFLEGIVKSVNEVAIEQTSMNTNDNPNGTNEMHNLGVNESKYQQWTSNEVLIWLKMNLVENGFNNRLISSFLKEFNDMFITGAILQQMKNNEKLIDNMRNEFSKKNQAFGIWLVIKSLIQNIGNDNDMELIMDGDNQNNQTKF